MKLIFLVRIPCSKQKLKNWHFKKLMLGARHDFMQKITSFQEKLSILQQKIPMYCFCSKIVKLGPQLDTSNFENEIVA